MGHQTPAGLYHKHTLSPRVEPEPKMLPLTESGSGLVFIWKPMSSLVIIFQTIPVMSLIKLSKISRRPRVAVTRRNGQNSGL